MGIRLGIDTGGTFTDIVAWDEAARRLSIFKVSSTPDDPSQAIVDGAAEAVPTSAALATLVHGTTVATNAVLQKRGSRTALLTTAGFRDILEIQRQDRPRLYDMRSRRTPPLIPRRLRFELQERVLHDGSVQTPLNEEELQERIAQIAAADVQAVVVGFLHSYANATHETLVGERLRQALPELSVTLSHQVVAEHGEYERFSTAAMNAYVQPVVGRYLSSLERTLHDRGFRAPIYVMRSNGGVMTASHAGTHAVQTVLSGPAGGVMAGCQLAEDCGHRNLITADMGGTSFDVSVIRETTPSFARQCEMGGLAISVPMLDIHTIGAGGGSIGWVDPGGALRVGPESAGASPGPACYGRGGRQPTVTDANLVLGRLAPSTQLGGRFGLDLEAARNAISTQLAEPLNLRCEQAAAGMLAVVNASMTAAIRKLTVERGLDPRQFSLCAFGGAGPLHGAELANEIGMQHTLVPRTPGVFSATGLLMSALREDRVRTYIVALDALDSADLLQTIQAMHQEARAALRHSQSVSSRTHLGMRYRGQGYELPVRLEPDNLHAAGPDFHREHQRMYGFSRADQPVEIVSIWVAVSVPVETPPRARAAVGDQRPATVGERPVYFGTSFHTTPIYRRESLGTKSELSGPAIIEQLDTTTVIPPGNRATVLPGGDLLLTREVSDG